VEIMTLRVNGIISPASAAGHVVLSSNLTAGGIRGTQPCSQMPGLARARHMPVRRVTHGDSRSLTEQPPLPLTCAAAGPPRGHLLCKQGVTAS
jgi:hypothetical protein